MVSAWPTQSWALQAREAFQEGETTNRTVLSGLVATKKTWTRTECWEIPALPGTFHLHENE